MYLWLPWWLSGKECAANAGDARDTSSISGWGRSPREGNGNPLQYSCLGNLMDRGACPQGGKRVRRDLATKPQQLCVPVTPIPLFYTSPFCLGNHNFVFYVYELFIIITTFPATLERQDESPHYHMRSLGLAGTVCPEDPQQGSGG